MKTERTQIHFLSDVLVAVASLELKVPNINTIDVSCTNINRKKAQPAEGALPQLFWQS